jgi:YaiO family outer membrane protein
MMPSALFSTKIMRQIFSILVMIIGFGQMVSAQADSANLSVDELFNLARTKAFAEQREEARILCRNILQKDPNYTDASVLMARTHAWEQNFGEARNILTSVLQNQPQYSDAVFALADVELWDNKPDAAMTVINTYLSKNTNDAEALMKKGKIAIALKQESEAVIALTRAIEIRPGCKECLELLNSIQSAKLKCNLLTMAGIDVFSDYFNPMYYGMVQLGKITAKGPLLVRVNYANRFGQNGVQPEADYYPRLWKRAYGFVNYGFSTSSLFARHRTGAEVFQGFAKNVEASAGFRYFYFNAANTLMAYTVSLGWYYKNYWLNARTFLTPDNNGLARTFTVTGRHYFKDAFNYVGVTLAAGFSPDARRIQTNEGLQPGNNIYLLKSQRAEVNIQKNIKGNLFWTTDLFYTHQELSFSYGNYIHIAGISTGIRLRF